MNYWPRSSISLLGLLLCSGLVWIISVEAVDKDPERVNPRDEALQGKQTKQSEPRIVNSTTIFEEMLKYPRIKIYSGLYRTGSSEEYNISNCHGIQHGGSVPRPRSLETFGTCVRLFTENYTPCTGNSLAIYPGRDLSILREYKMDLLNFGWVGHCLPNEFEFASISTTGLNNSGDLVVSKSVEAPWRDVPDFIQLDFDQNENPPDGFKSQKLTSFYWSTIDSVHSYTDKWNRTVGISASFEMPKLGERATLASWAAKAASLEKCSSGEDDLLFDPLPGDKFGKFILLEHVRSAGWRAPWSWNNFPISHEGSYEQWTSTLEEYYKRVIEAEQTSIYTQLAFLYGKENNHSRRPYGLFYNFNHYFNKYPYPYQNNRFPYYGFIRL